MKEEKKTNHQFKLLTIKGKDKKPGERCDSSPRVIDYALYSIFTFSTMKKE